MASVLTAGEIATYRKKGQWKKYYLAIAKYNTIFSAKLDTVPTSNDMVTQIAYVNGAYASGYSVLTDIRVDMTLYVGTSPGAYDLGMARIRKTPTSSILYLGEVSEIDWGHNECLEDTIYLTVVDDYQLRAKPIKLLNDVAFMDVDIPIGTNHTTFDPVPIMGGHRIAVLDDKTGLAGAILGPDANTAAWVLNSTIASVLWEIPGASLVDDLTEVNPVAVFDTPGIYPAYCTFTSTTGKTAWGVRYVIIFDHSADRPIIDFVHQNKNVTYDSGGHAFDVTINSNATQADIRDHSLCILFSENYIDGELVQRPEPFPAYQSIETTGYIGKYSISRNWEKGSATFTVEGAQGWLKKMQGFPSGLEFKIGAAAAWTDMPLLTTTRMIWHFLHWRTTATKVMDVILPPDTLYATAFNSMQKFLWDQIVEIAQPALFASPGVDCYGRFFLEVEPQMVPEASRSWPVVMDFVKSDLQGDINWDVETESQIGILMSAGLYINSTKAASTFFSLSPGHVMKQYGGDMSVMTNVPLVASQAGSNSLCGLYMGWKNNPNKRIEVSLRSNFKAIDLWPRQFFGLTILPADDPRGVGYSGNVIPREITFEDDRTTGFEYPIVNFEAESFPQIAMNGDIPINTTDSIEFPSFPNFDPDFGALPLIPPIILPLPDMPVADVVYTHCLVHSTNHGLFYTSDFDAVSPTWVLANGGMDNEDAEDIDMLLVDGNGGSFISFPLGSPGGSLRYASVPQGSYVTVLSAADMVAAFNHFVTDRLPPGGTHTYEIKALGINKGSNEIGVIICLDNAWWLLAIGGSGGFTVLPASGTAYANFFGVFGIFNHCYNSFTYGGGLWSLLWVQAGLANNHVNTYNSAGVCITDRAIAVGPLYVMTQARLGSGSNVLFLSGGTLLSTSNNFVTQSVVAGTPVHSQFNPIFASDLTGQYLMCSHEADVFRSSDGGLTWGDPGLCLEADTALILPADFPAVVSGIFCIDANRWIVIGKTNNNGVTGNVIIYTSDFGNTWVSKVGNLATLYPDSTFPNLALDLIQAWP